MSDQPWDRLTSDQSTKLSELCVWDLDCVKIHLIRTHKKQLGSFIFLVEEFGTSGAELTEEINEKNKRFGNPGCVDNYDVPSITNIVDYFVDDKLIRKYHLSLFNFLLVCVVAKLENMCILLLDEMIFSKSMSVLELKELRKEYKSVELIPTPIPKLKR